MSTNQPGVRSSQPGAHPVYAIHEQPRLDSRENLQQALDHAFKGSFNPHPTQYERVTVQFFRFKDSDLDLKGVEKELGKVFSNDYGYHVRYHEIGTNSHLSLTNEVQKVCWDLQVNFGGDRSLLILVFSGHAYVEYFNDQRILWVGGALDSQGNLEPGQKFIWKGATSMLAFCPEDVLHILDCSFAAEAVSGLGIEILAATSGTEMSPDDPQKSFTRALTRQLSDTDDTPKTAVQIYGELCRNRQRHQLEYMPFYCPSSSRSSVYLTKLGKNPTGKLPKADPKASSETRRIVLKAHLKEDLTPRGIAELKQWLVTNVPPSVTGLEIKVEGYFHSGSGVVLLSMPVEIWACLKDNPAFGFVAWVNSPNLLLGSPAPEQAPLRDLPIRGAENTRPGSGRKN